jgi:hypothetical protein
MFSDRATVTPVKNFRRYSGKPNSNKYTVICLTVIGVCLVGLGIALIIVGKEYDVQDLIILGPIFLLAGVAFTILMFFIIARPFCERKARKNKLRKNEKRVKEQKKKQDDTDNDTITKPTPYINDSKKKLKEAQNVHKRKSRPTRQTPITVKHITVYLLELGFPLYLLKFFTGVTVALSENIVS